MVKKLELSFPIWNVFLSHWTRDINFLFDNQAVTGVEASIARRKNLYLVTGKGFDSPMKKRLIAWDVSNSKVRGLMQSNSEV